jgi:hypothetical protein
VIYQFGRNSVAHIGQLLEEPDGSEQNYINNEKIDIFKSWIFWLRMMI